MINITIYTQFTLVKTKDKELLNNLWKFIHDYDYPNKAKAETILPRLSLLHDRIIYSHVNFYNPPIFKLPFVQQAIRKYTGIYLTFGNPIIRTPVHHSVYVLDAIQDSKIYYDALHPYSDTLTHHNEPIPSEWMINVEIEDK